MATVSESRILLDPRPGATVYLMERGFPLAGGRHLPPSTDKAEGQDHSSKLAGMLPGRWAAAQAAALAAVIKHHLGRIRASPIDPTARGRGIEFR